MDTDAGESHDKVSEHRSVHKRREVAGEIENGTNRVYLGTYWHKDGDDKPVNIRAIEGRGCENAPKTFQFCNFQSAGTVIVRRSVWNVTGAPSARFRHTQREQLCNRGNRPSGSFHQVGSAGQVLYKRPGSMSHR